MALFGTDLMYTSNNPRPVYLVDGARTPFLKVEGSPGPFTPTDLAVQCGRPLLLRQPFAPDRFDQVILGCVNVLSTEANPARIAALRLGMGHSMPANTVQVNCGSGLLAIDNGARAIREGSADLVLSGGSEALSHAPLQFGSEATDWFAGFSGARSLRQRLTALGGFRPGYFKPEISLLKGLTDPIVNLSMGQTAELLAHLFDISRREADEYAAESHRRLAHAWQEGFLQEEVTPAFSCDGRYFERDNGLRPDSTADRLARLNPVFEKPWGKVTAGNSSQVTDGASWVILASEAALAQYGLTPLARIVDTQWSALDPAVMGLGPVFSATALLQRQQLDMSAVDLWEINEAFAAQVLACLKAWDSDDFCRNELGLEGAAGAPSLDRLNVDGGAISLGHPVGASGSRIVLHLARTLQRLELNRGIATACVGGGQGGAILLEKP